MSITKWLVAGGAMVLIAGLISGCGHHGYHHGKGMTDRHVEKIGKKIGGKLDLDSAQRQKLDGLLLSIKRASIKHRQARADMLGTFMAEFEKPEMDRNIVAGLGSKHNRMIDEIWPEIADELAEFHSSLSDKQRATLLTKLEKFQARHKRSMY